MEKPNAQYWSWDGEPHEVFTSCGSEKCDYELNGFGVDQRYHCGGEAEPESKCIFCKKELS